MTHNRKRPARCPLHDVGNRTNLIFITVCTHKRKRILTRPDVQDLLIQLWCDTSHWIVGRYVLMPDHLHLFCAPTCRDPKNVRDWIAFWKSRAATNWPRPREGPIWQREAWDRQVRRGESYEEKWSYTRNNPIRAGLATSLKDWPYQGELNILPWHDI